MLSNTGSMTQNLWDHCKATFGVPDGIGKPLATGAWCLQETQIAIREDDLVLLGTNPRGGEWAGFVPVAYPKSRLCCDSWLGSEEGATRWVKSNGVGHPNRASTPKAKVLLGRNAWNIWVICLQSSSVRTQPVVDGIGSMFSFSVGIFHDSCWH